VPGSAHRGQDVRRLPWLRNALRAAQALLLRSQLLHRRVRGPGNVCSTTPEDPLADGDADTDVDADADADADGCDHFTYEDCLGCGQPCSAHRPFCCGNTCCSEECGTVRNDCSADPLR